MHQAVEVPIRLSAKMSESEKYREVWRNRDYRKCSPGADLVNAFMDICRPGPRSKIIDIGSGTGKGALALHNRNMDVWMMDFAENAMDDHVFKLLCHRFLCMDITEPWGLGKKFDYGYCCDVLEHLPTHHVDLAIWQATAYCKTLFLNISTVSDNFGPAMGHSLHLTVKPFTWWLDRLEDFGTISEARDLMTSGIYVLEQ